MHKLTRFKATAPALCVLLLFLMSPVAGASAYAIEPQNPAHGGANGAATKLPSQPAAANALSPSDPTLVQQNGAAFQASTVSMLPVSFPGDVSSGDMVIVGVSLLVDTVTGVADSLGSTYTPAGSVTGSGGDTYIYYATLHSSGTDTVTVTASNRVEQGSVWIFEVSGATATGVQSATGSTGSSSGSSTQTFQTSTSVGQSGAFLLAVVGTIELLNSPVAGTGFTLSPTQGTQESGIVEYSASGATYPSAFPGTYSSSSTIGWGEVGIALESSSSFISTTTTVGCSPGTVDAGTSTVCTGTVAGSGSSPPTGTVTFSDAGGTFTPSDVCTLSGAAPDRCEVFFTPAAGSEGTQTVTGMYSGDSTYSSSSGSFSPLTVDPRTTSTAVSCASPIEAGTSEMCTVTVADTGTGTAITPTGTVTVSDTLGVFPSGAGCTLSSGSCMVTFSPSTGQTGSDPVSAAYPGDTNHAPSGCGPCATLDVTSAPAGQVSVSITLDQFAGLGSTLSGANYFIIGYTSSGTPHTADEMGGTSHILADENTMVTISSVSSASNIFEEWCLSITGGTCQPTTVPVGTTGVSATYDYFDLQAQVINYGVSGGGSPVAPFFDYATAPAAPSASPVADDVTIGALPIAPGETEIWVLAGTVETFESVANTSPATPLTQWQGVPECSSLGGSLSCGTHVSVGQIGPFGQGGVLVTMEYYLQYSIPASFQLSTDAGSGYSSPTLTYYSSYGVQSTLQLGLDSPVSVWVLAGSIWSVNDLLGGSGSTQRWACTGACSATITSIADEINPTYTHQYLVTFGADDLWDCPNAATDTVYTCSLANSSPGSTSPSGPTWEDAGTPFEVSQTPPVDTSQGFGLGCGYSYAGDPSTPCYWGTSGPGITFASGCTHVSGNTCETEFTVNAAGTVLAAFGIPTSSGSAPTCGGGQIYSGTGCICPSGSVAYGGGCACDGVGCAGLAGWTGTYDPAYILVTAPNGVSQVGCNADGDLIDTIAGATVSSCAGGTGEFLVADPAPGAYEIQIFPVGASSSYNLVLSSLALDGDQLGTASLSGTVYSGAPQTVHLAVGADGSLTLSSNVSPPPAQTLNSCEIAGPCTTAFAVFDVKNASGAAVGGATVTLSATGLGSQVETTSSVPSTSALCTENQSWTADWGLYWGCSAGETGQFILTVGVTYTYTVTLQSGTILTGSFVASNPWDVTVTTVTT